MRRHRLMNHLPDYRLPQPPTPGITPAGFALCPLGMIPGVTAEQWLTQQWIYQQAFAQAQAVARPSLPERDLLAVWN